MSQIIRESLSLNKSDVNFTAFDSYLSPLRVVSWCYTTAATASISARTPRQLVSSALSYVNLVHFQVICSTIRIIPPTDMPCHDTLTKYLLVLCSRILKQPLSR